MLDIAFIDLSNANERSDRFEVNLGESHRKEARWHTI